MWPIRLVSLKASLGKWRRKYEQQMTVPFQAMASSKQCGGERQDSLSTPPTGPNHHGAHVKKAIAHPLAAHEVRLRAIDALGCRYPIV
jgi:hypothetical protein